MTRWPTRPLGELLTLRRNPVEPEPERQYVTVGVKSFGKGLFRYPPTLGAELSKTKFFRLPGRCLLVSNIQGWEGAVAVASEADAAECIASNRFLPYTTTTDDIDLHFVLSYLLSVPGREALRRVSPGTAVRNKTLSRSMFERLSVPAPSLAVQKEVVHRLAFATALTEAGNGRARVSEALASRTLTSLLLTVSKSEGVAKVPLGDLLAPVTEPVRVRPDERYRVAGVYSFGRGVLVRGVITGRDTKYEHLHRLRPDRLVYSKLKAWEGAVAVTAAEHDGLYVSSEFPTFEVDRSRVLPEFLSALVSEESFARGLAQETTGIGARRERVKPEVLLAQRVSLPAMQVQREVVAAHQVTRALQGRLQARDRLLGALRQSLLASIFSDMS